MTVECDHADGDASGVEVRMRRLVADGGLDLPAPGSGHTAERLRRLAAVAAHDEVVQYLGLVRKPAHIGLTSLVAPHEPEAAILDRPSYPIDVDQHPDPA